MVAPTFAVNAAEADGREALDAYEEGLRALGALTGREVLPHDARATSVWGVDDHLDTVTPLIHPDASPAPLTDAQMVAAAS